MADGTPLSQKSCGSCSGIAAKGWRRGSPLFVRRTCWSRVVCAGALLLLASLNVTSRASAEPLELAIKATYLDKFVPFVEWPAATFAAPDTPLTICVLANDPLTPLLEQTTLGQKDGNRSVVVRRLVQTDAATGCQIFYYEPDDPAGTQIVQGIQNRPVLTVTSSGTEPASPAMITFVIDQNRVRFDIDDAAATRAGLDIGSGLLALARTVKRAP